MADTINNDSISFYFEKSPPVSHPKPVFWPMIREFLDVAFQSAFKRQESIVHITRLILWHGFQVLLSLRLQLDTIFHSNLPAEQCLLSVFCFDRILPPAPVHVNGVR